MIEVSLLTRPDCRYCAHAVEVLVRVAEDHPLTVTRIAIDSEPGAALAARHGVLFAPGILLDGAMFGYGRLSERRLRRHLDQRRDRRPSPPDLTPGETA
jgi:glutaredoxin-like protein DUF836